MRTGYGARQRNRGYTLRTSRARRITVDDLGGYRLIDPEHNAVIAGTRFELALDDVEEWLARLPD